MVGTKRLLQGLMVLALLIISTLAISTSALATDDEDWDNDGVTNGIEDDLGTDKNNGTDYPEIDSDGDGYTDHEESEAGTAPDDATDRPMGSRDSDGDGYSDYYESIKGTDPYDIGDKPSTKSGGGGGDNEQDLVTVFAMTLIMTFAVFIIAAGGFTSYFGAGKSRGIGGGLLGLGVILLVLSYYIKKITDEQTLLGIITWDVSIIQLMVTVIGAMVGFLAAIVLFLVAIMKS